MIRTLPFDHDPNTGQVTKWWHHDMATDEVWIESVIDMDTIAESSKELRKNDTGKFGDGMHRVAQIPLPIYWKLKQRHVFEDQKEFRRWWQSDEAAPFKVKKCWI